MPAERIRIQPYDVRVSWGRDTEVQVGVGEYEDRSLLWMLFGGEAERKRWAQKIQSYYDEGFKPHFEDSDSAATWYDQLACFILNTIESEIAGGMEYSSVWATMNRSEVNTLIRLLRRARDQAFGKDE